MWKSIAAILIGYMVILLLFGAAYVVMLKWLPSEIQRYTSGSVAVTLLLAVVCAGIGVLGSWVAALIAGRGGLRLGMILGSVIVVLGLVKSLFAPDVEPFAAHLTLVLALAVGAVLGGGIQGRQREFKTRLPGQ